MDKDEAYNRATKIMEKLKPFVAIFILIFIILSCSGLIKYNKLQKEVKDSCGYERSDKVYCICDKQIVSEIYTIDNPYYNLSQSDPNFLLDPGVN